MRWRALLLASLLAFNLNLSAVAADSQTVVVTGEAALSLGTRAREEAIAQAARLAVEQAVGVYVVSETLVENMALVNDSILTKSSGFVSGYKILSESKANGVLTVKIEATVGVEPLVDQLAKLGLLRDWTVAVVLVSNGQARASNEAAKTQLNQMIIEKGFKVADERALVSLNDPGIMQQIQAGNYLAALPTLRDNGVDVLVVGTTLTRPTADGVIESYGGIKTVMTQGRIDARVIRVDTGEMLAAKSFQSVAGGSGQDMAEAKAIAQAAKDAGRFFTVEIAKLPAATSQRVQLNVRGLSFNRERSFRAALQQIPGIQKVQRKVYRNKAAQYEIEFSGKAEQLADALADAKGLKAFKFEIQSLTAGMIEAQAQ